MKTTNPAQRSPDSSKNDDFEELKQRIHGKLVDKLDLNQGRRARRRHPPPRNPAGRRAPLRQRRHPAQPQRARAADRRGARRDFRPGPAGNAAEGPDGQRHPHQRSQEHLRGAPRQDGTTNVDVPRQRAPDADHRPDHLRVGRRVDETCPMVDARLPDGSRFNAIIPPLALDGAVRFHPAVRRQSAEAGRPAELQGLHAGNGDAAGGGDQGRG